jgi:hypothetical protein
MGAKKGQKEDPRSRPDNEIAGEAQNWAEQVRALGKHFGAISAAYNKLNPNDSFAMLNWASGLQTGNLPGHLFEARKQLLDRLNHDVEVLLLGFDGSFRDESERRGWRVDGQWPLYYVEYFLRADISEPERSIKVGDRQLHTLHLPDIVAAIEEQLRSIGLDRIDLDEFLADLAAAYDKVVSADHRQASIWQVYRQFLILHQRPSFWRTGRTSAFRAFDEQKFRAAFTKMMQRDRVVTRDGRELRIFPPIKAEDGMFLYHPAEGRHAFVGRIELVPEAKEGA